VALVTKSGRNDHCHLQTTRPDPITRMALIRMRHLKEDIPPVPTVIQISDSLSQSENPDEPSFLTNLPAELRNGVYEILFLHDEPIVLRDPDDCKVLAVWRDGDSLYDGDVEVGEEDDKEKEVMKRQTAPITPNICSAMSLLFTCRQVYNEAIGYLYSENRFVMSVPGHTYNDDMDQVLWTAKWLGMIGSQFGMYISESDVDSGQQSYIFCRSAWRLFWNHLITILPT
jgi:hypothetical protein